jgi:hypothetical protein
MSIRTTKKLVSINPFITDEPVLQLTLFSLAGKRVHSHAMISWTMRAVNTNFQLWIGKMATFN